MGAVPGYRRGHRAGAPRGRRPGCGPPAGWGERSLAGTALQPLLLPLSQRLSVPHSVSASRARGAGTSTRRMCVASEQRSYAAACDALTALITAHYRPTGYDAAATFSKLHDWLQARLRQGAWLCFMAQSALRAAPGASGRGEYAQRRARCRNQGQGMPLVPLTKQLRWSC